MNMKALRISILCFVALLLAAPLLGAQDLSKYRNFSLGMSLAELSKQVDLKPLQAKLIHKHPALIQELAWWPKETSGTLVKEDSVWQVFFTFYNDELYRILVTYDRHATKGLTDEDMIRAISAQYGTATRPDAKISFPTNELYRLTEKVIARWEDSEYSINLFRATSLNTFGLVLFSKRLDRLAETSTAESVKLEGKESLQQAIDRQKKETDDLEAARQKNREVFHP
jgi:hypothetical protein